MKVNDTRVVTIVGAGLAGALLATLLARRGLRVELFERQPDPRSGDAPGGRSINLALAERGHHALRLAGLADEVDRFTLPMRGRMLHHGGGDAGSGGMTLQPYGARTDEVIHSTHRARLNGVLLDGAEATGRVSIRFGKTLSNIDWTSRRLGFDDGTSDDFEVLIGADGAGSAVRKAMQAVTDLEVDEALLTHGYRELTVPPTAGGDFALDPGALHIWPRGGFMLIALPNVDRSFTATLFLPKEGETSFEALHEPEKVRAFFRDQFPDAVPLMPDLEREFRDHPVGLLGTIRCANWNLEGTATLLGDAAHAVVPFHGQGMNAAFEDCVALARGVEDGERDWRAVFADYHAERKANADAIADMALENYEVMRESVRDPRFLLRKALEHELERRHGNRFIARYSLVMFHRVPYAEAYRRGEIQASILDALMRGADVLDDIDFERAGQLIRDRLAPIADPA